MVFVMTSAPLSNGVTHAYSKAVQIGGVLEAVTEEYDLKQDYDGKHGAPNAAAPKVFIKYFFVNTQNVPLTFQPIVILAVISIAIL